MEKANAAKQKRTAKQRMKIVLKVILIIILIIAVLLAACEVISLVGTSSNKSFIKNSITPVEYEEQLTPVLDDDGCYTFVTDREFKVVQLSDIHIGAGFLCIKKDSMAINAVASMVSEEKPDLVVVTGDIAYPVPYQAGTLNNKSSAVMFAELMEQLGVYWCLAFGNHDTESYSFFSREDIAKVYENHEKYPHCLFQSGPEQVDGVGNYAINIKNTKGEITQSLFMFDSHSYIDNDYLGLLWKYDCVHENQVEWYKDTVASFADENGGTAPKSLAFFHMPIQEMQTAYYEYRDNGFNDTADVQYNFGKAGEHDIVVYPSEKNYGLFDAFLETDSTKGIFFGHDHLNNFSLTYKGIQITYDYTIDYLAYSGIYKYGAQRGCTVIDISPDSSFNCYQENYYQDKYQTVKQKEAVTMDNYYSDAE